MSVSQEHRERSDAPALSDPALYAAGVPHLEFARRRRHAPVTWVDEAPLWRHGSSVSREFAGAGYWAVVRYATVAAVSRQPEVFSSGARGAFLTDPKTRQDLERTRELLINMDGPQHSVIRRLITAAFTHGMVEKIHHAIQTHAESLVRRLLEKEEFDLVRELSAELPLLVLADLLGMPCEDRDLMYKWSNCIVGFDDPEFGAGSIDAYKRTFAEAFAYAKDLAAAKRRCPADDLVTALLRSETHGRRLGDSEFCHLWILLVIAGNESTRHLLSGSLLALMEWPAERDRLIGDPRCTRVAVEELLRWVSPIMQFRRTAMRDVQLDGQQIKEGDKVVLYYASANRDEEVFSSADRLDLARAPNPHLAFGVGPHFCLGAHLARVEGAILLDALRPHLKDLALVGPISRLESNFMNGIKRMPASFIRSGRRDVAGGSALDQVGHG